MGLNRNMKIGETLYLQRGEEVIAFHIHEFTQGEHAKLGHLIKVNVLVDAPKSWSIDHHTAQGTSLKGKNHAQHQQPHKEKVLSQYEFKETQAEYEQRVAKDLEEYTRPKR